MTKRYFWLIPIIIMVLSTTTVADELKFETGDWNKIKESARKQNKLIFLDAYTDWCGWCKVMDKETFTDSEVIEYVNKNFVPVKYEMETGFGKILAMKYRVRGFPSQLYFTPDGKLIYMGAGYQVPKVFLESLALVKDHKNHMKLNGISDNLEPGFPDFYKAAFGKNGSPDKKYPTPDQVVEFLDQQSDLFDEVSWSVMSQFQSNEKYNTYFLDNIAKYQELYGKSGTNNKLYSVIYKFANDAIKDKNEDGMEKVYQMITKYDSENSERNIKFYKVMYYEKTENWTGFSKLIESEISSGKIDDDQINEYCWNIYEKCNDKPVLNLALNWIKPIAEQRPNYMNVDTYAALLFKTENFLEAKKYAESAIELGRKSKENIKETEKLLEKIKEKFRD